MPIFDNPPNTWQDLQNRVGQLFTEIGCDVQIGTTVRLVRGAKEVDVLVRDPVTVPQSTYLCECKFWSTAIPQETVHGFRTVVGDFGAHRGYIISKVGFQAGAFAAVQNTNVELLTFDQLQAVFFDRWRIAMGQKYRPEADVLFPYWDYPGRMPQFAEHVSGSLRLYRKEQRAGTSALSDLVRRSAALAACAASRP